jgi:arginyl-tRNA synthetase
MFRSLLNDRLQAALAAAEIALPDDFTPEVVLAADTRYGDYQTNAAMVLAKQLKSNPRALAEKIKEHLQVADLCEKITVDGPGFLNLTLSSTALAARLSLILTDDHLGVPRVSQPRTIVVDFSAPNVAKPMHVGHIRSTFIGDCLARIARFLGHHVITDNHIGDWGTQFGMIIHAWKTKLDHTALKTDAIHELVRCYKLINAEAKSDEAVLETCKGELVKLQQGDAENLGIWRECVRLTQEQLDKVYSTLDIHFDHTLGESFFNDALAPLVADLLQRGIATESLGAAVIASDGTQAPEDDPFLTRDRETKEWTGTPLIIQKSDGGFLYGTTDLATVNYRAREWKADEAWYVVGAPQQLHFRQVIEAARRMGHTIKLVHIAFGSILGPDGKMFKTRTGESVGLIEVLDEAVERARAVVQEREGLSDEEKNQIADIIGIGAVKYAELSQHRMTDYKFSWDKMLSLQGNTAPYLINAYVRTRAIFRKLEGGATGSVAFPNSGATGSVALSGQASGLPHLSDPAERALAMKLAQFAETTHDVLPDHRPNLLAQYLYELATTYHAFYEACPVLRAEGAVRETRLALCEATSRVLKQGLGLLGIQVTERM